MVLIEATSLIGVVLATFLTHLRSMFPSYRNQSIDMHRKSIDWFLYDGNGFRQFINAKYKHVGNLHLDKNPSQNYVKSVYLQIIDN